MEVDTVTTVPPAQAGGGAAAKEGNQMVHRSTHATDVDATVSPDLMCSQHCDILAISTFPAFFQLALRCGEARVGCHYSDSTLNLGNIGVIHVAQRRNSRTC